MQQNIQQSEVKGQRSEVICYHCELEKLARGLEPYLPERCILQDCQYHRGMMEFANRIGL